MIENKRYKISDEAHYVYSDIYDSNEILRNDEVIDLLNEQDEMINELENENKRLKNKLELYEHYVTFTAIDDDDEVL